MLWNPVRVVLAVAIFYGALLLLAAPPAAAGNGSDCCVNNGSPGCDDAGCEALICALDSFCCEVTWDGICADEALQFCGGGVCNNGDGGACLLGDPPVCVVVTNEVVPNAEELRIELPEGETPQSICEGAGGSYQGDGSICAPVPVASPRVLAVMLAAMLVIGLLGIRWRLA